MSLIKCNECGKEISDKATLCPNCGCPIEYPKLDIESVNQNVELHNNQPCQNTTTNVTSAPKKEAPLGIAGLILALLFCFPLFPLAGLIMCIISLRNKNKKSTCAKIGIAVSIISLIISCNIWDNDSKDKTNSDSSIPVSVEKSSSSYDKEPENVPTTEATSAPEVTSTPEAVPTPEVTPSPTTNSEITSDSSVTVGQRNALKKAKSYLDFSAFSHQGLIEQLEYEDFTKEEATYAVDNCGADWNEQALKKAKSYLDFSAFSYQGLIEQLEYEDFTKEEATYAVDNCGADWNEQAAKKAKSYLDFSSFSKNSLIEQLEYEGFTHEQAVYGAEENGY